MVDEDAGSGTTGLEEQRSPGRPRVRQLATSAATWWMQTAARLDTATQEKALADFFVRFRDAADAAAPARSDRDHFLRYCSSNPREAACAFIASRRLPQLVADLGDDRGGRIIVDALGESFLGIPLRWTALAIVEVPADAASYRTGGSRRTLRKKTGYALRAGVTWRCVDDDQERRRLIALGNATEQSHPDARYRRAAPDNQDLLDHGVWVLAERAGEPLAFAVATASGEWAWVRYSRTLGNEDLHSLARYTLIEALVTVLSRMQVRFLVESSQPVVLSNGLRHFQRMVGFRYARIRIRRPPRAP